MKEIAKALSDLPKKNVERPRVVIITQGPDPTILAIRSYWSSFIAHSFSVGSDGQETKEFVVKPPLQIVDTNGAGDSFVGGSMMKDFKKTLHQSFFVPLGFLAYLALGKTHEEAIQAGAYCAFECIQLTGCTYPPHPNFNPNEFWECSNWFLIIFFQIMSNWLREEKEKNNDGSKSLLFE